MTIAFTPTSNSFSPFLSSRSTQFQFLIREKKIKDEIKPNTSEFTIQIKIIDRVQENTQEKNSLTLEFSLALEFHNNIKVEPVIYSKDL